MVQTTLPQVQRRAGCTRGERHCGALLGILSSTAFQKCSVSEHLAVWQMFWITAHQQSSLTFGHAEQWGGSVSQPSSFLSGGNSLIGKEDSIASACSGLFTADRLQSSSGSTRSTTSVQSANGNVSSKSHARNLVRANTRGFAEPIPIKTVAESPQQILSSVSWLTDFCDQGVADGKGSICGQNKTREQEKAEVRDEQSLCGSLHSRLTKNSKAIESESTKCRSKAFEKCRMPLVAKTLMPSKLFEIPPPDTMLRSPFVTALVHLGQA